MKSIQVKDVILGDGKPKVCCILDGPARRDLLQQIDEALEAGAELLEWQVDTYKWFDSLEKVDLTLLAMSEKLAGRPLIFNLRPPEAGGFHEISVEDFRQLNQKAADSNIADIIELDLNYTEQLGSSFIQGLQEKNVKVILSDTSLDSTPEDSLLVFRLNLMAHLGADIGKIAALPQVPQDVFHLMEITFQAEAFVQFPIITVSLGELGRFSRISGELSSSALAYATLSEHPREGEFNIKDLTYLLQMLEAKDSILL